MTTPLWVIELVCGQYTVCTYQALPRDDLGSWIAEEKPLAVRLGAELCATCEHAGGGLFIELILFKGKCKEIITTST